MRSLMFSYVLVIMVAGALRVQCQQLFGSPDDAAEALIIATKAHDQAALATIFGPRLKDLLSGDSVADKNAFDDFAAKIEASAKFETMNDSKATILIGDDDWPFAVPIVRVGDKWRFDTDAGVEEVINRRIGRNETEAISVCQVYALAQFEYFNGEDRDGDQVAEFAQRIASSPGKHDGLFWPKIFDDDEESPLGEFIADAAAEGYKTRAGMVATKNPFHGYHFKILYGQGPSAPGGKFDYVINGNMIAGFALVAYPANWGNSGIMTFVVNQEGRVYQKNLGPKTASIARSMIKYDPDVSWTLANTD